MRGIRILFIGSLLVSLVCFLGFIWAYQDQKMPHKTVAAVAISKKVSEKNEMKVVALGDSLTKGFGDASGKGYVGDVIDQLRAHSHATVSQSNLAINGQTSGQLIKQLGQQEVLRQIRQSDVILMTIGGNDLNQQGRTLNDLDSSHISQMLQSYKNNLTKIMQQIRSVNPDATLYFVGLYNPYLDGANAKATSQIVRQWNNETADLLAGFSDTVFVPTMDLFQILQEKYLYADHFHPNSTGYQRIAERIVPLLIQ
jgi:lysophospholipase L1-like esterase